MAGAGEDAHVRTDLGDDRRGRRLLDAGHTHQPLDGGAKGRNLSLDALVEIGNVALDLLDLTQVPAEQIAVVLADAAAQRLDQRPARALEPRAAELGNLARVALAGNDRLQHATAARPHRIGQHRGQLDVGVLQDLVDPVLVANDLAHRLPARPASGRAAPGSVAAARSSPQSARAPADRRSRSHRSRRSCGPERHAPAGHWPGSARSAPPACATPASSTLRSLPSPRGVTLSPSSQSASASSSRRRGAEPAHLVHHLATDEYPRARHHFDLVNVEASAASIENFHRHLLQQPIPSAVGARIWTIRSLPNVLGNRTGLPVRSLATLTGARQILRPNLTTGSRHQAKADLCADGTRC